MKKFLNILLVFLFLSVSNLMAQTFGWGQSAFGNGSNDDGTSVCNDTLGNVYIAGSFTSLNLSFSTATITNASNTGSWDVCLVKYDANGNFLWARQGGGSNNDEGRAVCTDKAGNVYVTGTYANPQAVFGTYTLTSTLNQNSYIAKYDPAGNILWVKNTIGGIGNSVFCDQSGNAIMAGRFNTSAITFGTYTLTNAGLNDCFIVKYDPNGNVLWAKREGGSGLENYASVGTDNAGNIFATGYYGSPNLVLSTYTLTSGGSLDVFVVKYDPSGNVIWAKSGSGTGSDGANAITVEPSGVSYLTGNYSSLKLNFGTDTIKKSGTSGNFGIFFIKFDASGNVLWTKSAGGTSPNHDIGYGAATYTNGVYFSGFFTSANLTFGTYTLSKPSGASDGLYVANFDPNGNLICCEALANGGLSSSGLCADKLGSAFICSDFIGPSLVVGTNTLTALNFSVRNILVAKFDCGVATDIENITQNNKVNGESVLRIYPNPNNGSFKLQIENDNDNGSLIIFNSLGQKVHEQKISRESNEVMTYNLAEGLYHCVFKQDKEQKSSCKLVIVR